jgi:predicted nucleic acid-binding protein
MLRVVLDHAVLLRGLINPHSPCGSLLSKYSCRYRAIFSEATRKALLILPVHPVLLATHPSLLKVEPKRAGRLAAQAEMTNLPSDDFDNAVIATALAARVDYIVAEDPALLDYHDRIDIPIVDAQTFIMLLESEASS